jgi:hypothetical protein
MELTMTSESNKDSAGHRTLRSTDRPLFVDLVVPTFPHNAIVFFCLFSRFEFALKKAGFIRGNPGQAAWPDWSTFGLQPKIQKLYQGLTQRASVRYIIDHPPKRQIVSEYGGKLHLEWQDWIGRVENMEMLIEAVRQTRNNLFHGGKSATEPVERAERNEQLIDAAIEILRAMLLANENVKVIFDQERDD